MEDRIRIRKVEVLSQGWSTLKKTTLDFRRRDGRWQTQIRETYDRGDGCAVLLYNRGRGSVLLIRQFRFPAYVNGHPDTLIEVCAGLLDTADPESCVRKETAEETLESLGTRLGLSRERIRQVEAEAIEKLRNWLTQKEMFHIAA